MVDLMYEPRIMKIDVEKALRSSGIWKMVKKGSQGTDSSCIVYKELTWDELDDLEYNLRSVGLELSEGEFPDLSIDYTTVALSGDGETGAALICSVFENVLYINRLVCFSEDKSCIRRLVEKLASELWLSDDDHRPSTVMFLSTDPDVESFTNKIFEDKYLPETIGYSVFEEQASNIPADAHERIRRDIIRNPKWKDPFSERDS